MNLINPSSENSQEFVKISQKKIFLVEKDCIKLSGTFSEFGTPEILMIILTG